MTLSGKRLIKAAQKARESEEWKRLESDFDRIIGDSLSIPHCDARDAVEAGSERANERRFRQ